VLRCARCNLVGPLLALRYRLTQQLSCQVLPFTHRPSLSKLLPPSLPINRRPRRRTPILTPALQSTTCAHPSWAIHATELLAPCLRPRLRPRPSRTSSLPFARNTPTVSQARHRRPNAYLTGTGGRFYAPKPESTPCPSSLARRTSNRPTRSRQPPERSLRPTARQRHRSLQMEGPFARSRRVVPGPRCRRLRPGEA
jgi:hypothetical protein